MHEVLLLASLGFETMKSIDDLKRRPNKKGGRGLLEVEAMAAVEWRWGYI